jgi:hypothetical protein
MVDSVEFPNADSGTGVGIAGKWIDKYNETADVNLGSGDRRSVLSTAGIDQFSVYDNGIR